MLRLALAALHLLALGVGLGAVWARARALRPPIAADAIRRALAADAWWGVAALLWISTGLARALLGTEKVPGYYWQNHWFWGKMGLLGLILALEVWPMLPLIRWRRAAGRGQAPDLARARAVAGISYAQTALVVLMVGMAVTMARDSGA